MELYPNNWTGLYVNPYIAEAGGDGLAPPVPHRANRVTTSARVLTGAASIRRQRTRGPG